MWRACSPQRRPRATADFTAIAAALACFALAAPAALADSIVYEKDGNIWLTAPDGRGQRQVTTAGGYARPTQANDGTIVAVKDKLLHRMDRAGNLLNLAGDSDWGGPFTPALAPGGALVAHNYFRGAPSLSQGFHTSISHATRETDTTRSSTSAAGATRPGSATRSSRRSESRTRSPGNEDPDLTLSGGEVDASMTRFAATDSTVIRLYRLNAPPPAIAVDSTFCLLENPTGSFFRPTWSPNGGSLAWQEDDGIWAGAFDLATCQGTATLVIPGGRAPDWGPADVGPTAGPGASELSAKAPKRIRLGALLRGLK